MQVKKTQKDYRLRPSAEEAIQKTVTTALLLDAYGVLLTQRQRIYLSLFYEEDYSLAEIGEKFSISRQAVHDAIRHGEAQLKGYEDSLHIIKKNQERQKIAQKLRVLIGTDTKANELLDQLL